MIILFCKNCGKELKGAEQFCGECGVQIIHKQTCSKKTMSKYSKAIIFINVLVLIICGFSVIISKYNSSLYPPIKINDIYIKNELFGNKEVVFEIENISNKDIAYIDFETYFYDRMGGRIDENITLKYTGPLYSKSSQLVYYDYFVPQNTAVIFPKKIKVTFVDDEELTFTNSFYGIIKEYYGKELKD